MGQIASRHRPDHPVSLHPTVSSLQSSTTRIADDSSLSPTQPIPDSPPPHPSHHNSDLPHQLPPLPPKRSRRRSFLGTIRSPLRSCLNSQRTSLNEAEPNNHASNAHKRWIFDRRRRKTSEPARTLHEYPEVDQPQLGGPSRTRMISEPSAPTANQKGNAKEDKDALSASPNDLPSTALVGPTPSTSTSPSSGSSTLNVSQTNSVPLQSTATDLSPPSSSASPFAPSSSPSPRDPLALNHDPAPLPSTSVQHDDTTSRSRDNSEAFNVMERPATPPDPSLPPPPLPEARRNFPAAGTLVVVQGVVHTSDVSQPAGSEHNDATPRRASSVPPPTERPSRRRFSDLLARPMRSRRSSYAAPESQSSETSANSESENQEGSSPTSETSQDSPTQEDLIVPASRPLSLSPTSIDVLGTLLRCALFSLVFTC